MFSTQLELPTGRSIRLYEPTNRDFLDIVKFCSNNDFRGLESIVHKYVDFEGLNVFEQLYVYIAFQALYIEDTINIVNKDDNSVQYQVNTLLINLDNAKLRGKEVIELGDHIVTFDIPLVFTDDIFDCVSIDDIEVDDLDTSEFKQLAQLTIDYAKHLQEITLLKADESIKISGIKISLFDDAIRDIILKLYAVNLDNLYEIIFVFSQKFPGINYFELSILDTKVLLNLLSRQEAEQNKQLSNNDSDLSIGKQWT